METVLNNMETNSQLCPICRQEVKYNSRYPKYVCAICKDTTTDENGRKVIFYSSDLNEDVLTDELAGIYEHTKEKYSSNICYIRGAKCHARIARFGGIVIEKID
jgi:hypothetical protein